MPNNTAANGAKNSTSVAFKIVPTSGNVFQQLSRTLWRITYRTRKAILRYLSTGTYAIERRREIAEAKALMHPLFQFRNTQ